MKKSGMGILLLLAVALIIAYLMIGNMKTLKPTDPAAADISQTDGNPVQQAQDAVDALNERMGSYDNE